MTESRFFKLSGGGNDFVALADPNRDPDARTIRALCRRGVSLGADGLFVLRPEGSEVRMDYWNSDGQLSELCLNGTRCAARLARHLGWVSDSVVIITASGRIRARSAGPDEITLEVPSPTAAPEELSINLGSATWNGWRSDVGVPHFVLLWQESLANAPVEALGSAIRWASDFAPPGTNVNFARFPSPNLLELRSFERGVEAETLACGTGILASTAVGIARGIAELPLRVKTLGGFPFEVTGAAERGRLQRWSLTGEARLLAEGEIHPGALVEPEPPRWAD